MGCEDLLLVLRDDDTAAGEKDVPEAALAMETCEVAGAEVHEEELLR